MSDIRKDIVSMYDDVEMPGGWKFNHIKTIKRIDLMSMSKFESGEIDEQGYYKFFVDITTAPCDVASKFIDIDVQNIRFLPRPSMSNDVTVNEMTVYHMSKDFKIYADKEKLGSLINELGDDLPKYGSIFVKDVMGSARRVAPQNMKFDPSAKNLRQSSFVAEPVLMRKSEILRMNGKWNKLSNFEQVVARGETTTYLVYQHYENYGTDWKYTVHADVFCWKEDSGGVIRSLESNINYRGESLPSIILHEEKVKDIPYFDHKWKHVDGRLLGYGFVEYLMPNQIAVNEAENLERQGLYYSSLVLLQGRAPELNGKNIRTNYQNGDYLYVDSEITKIPLEERNLAAYNSTRNRWEENTMRKTFSSEIATGGNLPSRTPLGVANLQASMVTSFYDKKRENFGMFLKDDVVSKIVIPSFKNKTSKEHILTIGSEEKDIEEYERFLTKIYVDKAVSDYAEANGYFPSTEQRKNVEQQVRDRLRGMKDKHIKIADWEYENAIYKMEIDVTGEGVDTGIRSQFYQQAMNILGSNPAILQNETTRTIFLRFIGLGGISPQELGIDTSAIDQTPIERGGSIAAPVAPQASQGSVMQTLA